jgi:hypothetical protein
MWRLVIEAEVGEDRRVTLQLPPEVPLGRVQLSVALSTDDGAVELTREEVRARLLTIGAVSDEPFVFEELYDSDSLPIDSTPDEVTVKFPPEITTMSLIDEDRGPR